MEALTPFSGPGSLFGVAHWGDEFGRSQKGGWEAIPGILPRIPAALFSDARGTGANWHRSWNAAWMRLRLRFKAWEEKKREGGSPLKGGGIQLCKITPPPKKKPTSI